MTVLQAPGGFTTIMAQATVDVPFDLAWDGTLSETIDPSGRTIPALAFKLSTAGTPVSTLYLATSLEPFSAQPAGEPSFFFVEFDHPLAQLWMPFVALRASGWGPFEEVLRIPFLGVDLEVTRTGPSALVVQASLASADGMAGSYRWRIETEEGTPLPVRITESFVSPSGSLVEEPRVIWRAEVTLADREPALRAERASLLDSLPVAPTHAWTRTPPEEGSRPLFPLSRAIDWAAADSAEVASFLAAGDYRVADAAYDETSPQAVLGLQAAAVAQWRVVLASLAGQIEFTIAWYGASSATAIAPVHQTTGVERGEPDGLPVPQVRPQVVSVDHAYGKCVEVAEPDSSILFGFSDLPFGSEDTRPVVGGREWISDFTLYTCGGLARPAFAMDAHNGLYLGWRP